MDTLNTVHPLPAGTRVQVGAELGEARRATCRLDIYGNSYYVYAVKFDTGYWAAIDQWWIVPV